MRETLLLEEEFARYLKLQNSSPSTVKSYLVSLRLYRSLFSALDTDHLLAYRSWLLEHYEPSTVNSRIYGINRYLDFLSQTEETGSFRLSPIKSLPVPYLDRVISQEDYIRLRDGLKRDGNCFWYFLVRFLGTTGARVSEVIQIKAEHLSLGYMDLCSKGGKVRRIYFPVLLCQEALEWIRERGIASGFLFTGRKSRQITPRGIGSQLKVLACRYGIDPETVYPHAFRHRFALNFLDRFNDISLLADLLGHESIETTRIYLNRSCREQRELIDRIVTW